MQEEKYQIEIEDLSVYYFTFNQGINSVKDLILNFGSQKPFKKKFVLNNINLKVKKGESIGILGKNGCGKSTLLKVIAGLLKSKKGKVVVRGEIAPLLSIGTGVEMELSGIENIKLISSLFESTSGMSTADRIEAVKEFSGLKQEDLESQVKTYSTGMFSRLSFSIAVCERPEILIIDEVLVVGDAGFQQKCINRIKDFQAQGSTILFVSHGEDDVRKICSRAICIKDGQIVKDGDVEETIKYYNSTFDEQ